MTDAELNAKVVRWYLMDRYNYEPTTGQFSKKSGRPGCGRPATNGYLQIEVAGKRYMAHRLAWLYVYGEWPSGQIDHINQDRLDNRISNLRVVTNKQNGENVKQFKHNKSGRTGVYWVHGRQKWGASIKQHGKSIMLGEYECLIDAVAARVRAEKTYFTHAPIFALITHNVCKSLKSIEVHPRPPAPSTCDSA